MFDRFKAYLLRNGHIKQKYVPYSVKWVSDCYGWQVKQADYALRLYNFFLSQEKKDRGH